MDGLLIISKLQKILRNAGVSTEIYPGENKLKKQMEYANKINAPSVIVVIPENSSVVVLPLSIIL